MRIKIPIRGSKYVYHFNHKLAAVMMLSLNLLTDILISIIIRCELYQINRIKDD